MLKEPVQILQVGDDHICERIKQRFRSPQLISGTQRLIKHEKKHHGTDFKINLESILDTLKMIQVFVLDTVKTQLCYNGVVINGSDETKHSFLRICNDGLKIFISRVTDNERSIFVDITGGLLSSQLKDVFRDHNSVLLLSEILQCPLDEIHLLLDRKGINRDSSVSSVFDGNLMQQPGDLVPLELHGLLGNEFVDFEEGEFVALEVGNENEPSYIYAIVRRCDDNSVSAKRMYGIQTTTDESVIKDISAYDLYRFDRSYQSCVESISKDIQCLLNSANILRSFDEIMESIRMLLESCNSMSPEEKKKIIRRLYLRWHPDNHSDETKDLATNVFQSLQHLLENDGYNTNFQNWDTQAQAERRNYQDYCRNYAKFTGNRSFSSFAPPTFSDRNPQPTEAKRWLRQAQYDLSASEEETNSHEWICLKAHQVLKH